MTTAVFLNNDRKMPLLGLGVYKATGENEAENAVIAAVESGYRMIDTAPAYKNEENVGRGIARCGVPRKDLFITTKIWNTAQRLATSKAPSSAASTVSAWIISICILSTGRCPAAI